MDILWETDQELLLFIFLIGDNNYEIHNNELNSCRKFPYIYNNNIYKKRSQELFSYIYYFRYNSFHVHIYNVYI